jgi:DNA-binding NtrC family response regulator
MGKLLPTANGGQGANVIGEVAGAFVEGISASMRPVEAVIRELSQSDVPVLLLAEAGAGKHATARRIHEMSRRSTQPFRALSCSHLKPEDLDLAQNAEGAGTVFLEEVADLSASAQAHLRDVLLRSEKHPNGHSARLICGSARDLEVEVKIGRLREDLYYRISGVCLRLPPLRQRKEDIPLLTAHFLRKYAEEFRRPIPELSSAIHRLFDEYSWPGNLRELESAVRVLVALGDERLAMGGLRALLRQPYVSNGGGVSLKAASRAASQEAEKELILKVLTRTRWNRRRAAAELQISYKALLYKLKQIGCEGYGA